MVYKKNELNKLISRFIRSTTKSIPVKQIYLFGSYAYGNPNKYSDIDFAVISPKFAKMNDIERISYLLNIVHRNNIAKDVDIETVGYTPQELDNAGYFDLAGEIRDKGKIVYSK